MAAKTTEKKVREQMARERENLANQLDAAVGELTARAQELDTARQDLDAALGASIDNGPLPDELAGKINDATGAVLSAAKARIAAVNRRAELHAALDALDDPQEVTRRVEQAEQLAQMQRAGKKPTNREAAAMVLLANGGAMHYREVAQTAVRTGLIATKGKTIEATFNALLSVAARDTPDDFMRVAPGVFALKNPEAMRKRLDAQAAPQTAEELVGDAAKKPRQRPAARKAVKS